MKSKKPASTKPVQSEVFISGESPMVETMATVCLSRGYAVVIEAEARAEIHLKEREKNVRFASTPSAATSVGIDLTNVDIDRKKRSVSAIDKALPPTALVLSSSVTVSAGEQLTWVKQKHRLVGIGALPSLLERPLVEVAPTASTPRETLDVVLRFLGSLGKEVELVQDRIGLVLPRILCQLVNESMFAVMEDVATPSDIDTAMKLGANYPAGPIEWGSAVGLKQVCAVLRALERDLSEDRYRVAPLLTQLSLSESNLRALGG